MGAVRHQRCVVITGAAGRIGSALADGLSSRYERLRLTDVEPVPPRDGAEVLRADLTVFEDAASVLAGCDTVVHLAAIPAEDDFGRIVDVNVRGTYNVFEAARLCGVRRVVFASTYHVLGFHPIGRPVPADGPPRPDTLYAVSKVFGEGLGRLYAEKFGISVVCVRIGRFKERPRSGHDRRTWLSPEDAVELFRCCIDARSLSYLVVYGLSKVDPGTWDTTAWRDIGYEPSAGSARRGAARADEQPETERQPFSQLGDTYVSPAYHGAAARRR